MSANPPALASKRPGAVALLAAFGKNAAQPFEPIVHQGVHHEGAQRSTSQELIRFARARVGYKAPEEIVVLDAMPLNATGKVDRVTLKRMAEERVAGGGPG